MRSVKDSTKGEQTMYDLLLKGCRVIDPLNKLNDQMDIAIDGGNVAMVAAEIDPATAHRVLGDPWGYRYAYPFIPASPGPKCTPYAGQGRGLHRTGYRRPLG